MSSCVRFLLVFFLSGFPTPLVSLPVFFSLMVSFLFLLVAFLRGFSCCLPFSFLAIFLPGYSFLSVSLSPSLPFSFLASVFLLADFETRLFSIIVTCDKTEFEQEPYVTTYYRKINVKFSFYLVTFRLNLTPRYFQIPP